MDKNIIPEATRKEILRRIRSAEKEHNVRVLYAVESGSRAWGFASQNSDFDVRFIYAHPKDWYVAVDLEDKRDVIEYEIVDEIDINGWDIRKALKLFWNSNPAFVEWIHSPIQYIDDGFFAASARKLIDDMYSVEKGIYHYRSMAKTNFRGYLKRDEVPIKKYFYVLRPLLAIRWLEHYKQPAPIEFERLRELIQHDIDVNMQITKLLDRKRRSTEKEVAPIIKPLNEFIERELLRVENLTVEKAMPSRSMNALNHLFKQCLK